MDEAVYSGCVLEYEYNDCCCSTLRSRVSLARTGLTVLSLSWKVLVTQSLFRKVRFVTL